jgi:hypothetical protein
MDLYNIKKENLEPIDRDPFKLEKDIQSLVENNMDTLFGVEFVKSEFSLNEFRLDSLCFDHDTNSFVIVEYKRGSSYSVIDQGYSYLSLMLNNKSDFILEYNETKNKSIKRNDVDWSQSRIIFISTSFSTYQKNSVNFKDIPFELWEIKKFSNNLISLDQISSNSKESIDKVGGNKNKIIKNVNKEVKVFNEDDLLEGKSDITKELYQDIKERVCQWDDVIFQPKKRYICIQKNKKIKIYVKLRKNDINLGFYGVMDFTGNVKKVKKKFVLDDPKKLFKLKKDKYREQYSHIMSNKDNFDYIMLMLKQKFET